MTPEHRAEKEAFVSYLSGGDIWEINLISLVIPAVVLLWSILQTRQSFFKPYTLVAAATDFLLHCCTILFATTAYSSSPQVLTGFLVLPTVATMLQAPAKTEQDSKPETNGKPAEGSEDKPARTDLDPLPVKPFITTYRAAMMITTCTSILAVDFPIFPRRFAKTEAFGTSLMDLGVGSFVFAAGLVAARQQLKEEQSGSKSFFERLKTAMRHSLPLLVLGFVRLWSVKGLEYAEHVSEYGVHWNFFFTLALLPPTFALLQPVLSVFPSYGLLAFIIAICQELILFLPKDVKRYILLSERNPGDWLSQNREGVFSFLGYVAIFIAGVGIGAGILPRDPDPAPPAPKDSMDEDAEWLASVLGQPAEVESNKTTPAKLLLKPDLLPKTAFVHLARWTIIWFIFCVWAMWHYGPHLYASRRMANLAYIVWVCGFNSAQLLLLCVIEAFTFPDIYNAKDDQTERQRISDATSKVMHAFNRNGLATFLFANLLTGGINMTIETLHMGDVQAMVILVSYIGIICGTALLLDYYDISIKL